MSLTNEQKLWFTEYEVVAKEVYQNSTNVYSDLVEHSTINGEEKISFIEGTQEFAASGSDFDKHTYNVLDREKRKITASGGQLANWWSHMELARAVYNPIPAALKSQGHALSRWNSATIRDAITGNAISQYEGTETMTSKALPAQQVIGNGTAAITTDDFQAIKSRLVRNYALQEGETINCAIPQEAVDILQKDSELMSTDFNGGRAPLIDGMTFGMIRGVNVVLDIDVNWSSTIYSCPFWVKSAIEFATQQSPIIRQGELQERNFIPQAYMKVDNGCSRMRDFGAGNLQILKAYT